VWFCVIVIFEWIQWFCAVITQQNVLCTVSLYRSVGPLLCCSLVCVICMGCGELDSVLLCIVRFVLYVRLFVFLLCFVVFVWLCSDLNNRSFAVVESFIPFYVSEYSLCGMSPTAYSAVYWVCFSNVLLRLGAPVSSVCPSFLLQTSSHQWRLLYVCADSSRV